MSVPLENMAYPKEYRRGIVTKRPPMFLINALCRNLFGWHFASFTWDRIGERYLVKFTWVRRPRYVMIADASGRKQRFYLHERMEWRTALRVLWLHFRSTRQPTEAPK